MPALIIRLLGWLVATVFGDNVIRFVAGKAITTAMFVVILPIVLNNFIYDLLDMCMTIVGNNASSAGFSGQMSFGDLAGYLIHQFMLPDALSVLVSAMILRVVLNHVPFLRV